MIILFSGHTIIVSDFAHVHPSEDYNQHCLMSLSCNTLSTQECQVKVMVCNVAHKLYPMPSNQNNPSYFFSTLLMPL